MLLSIYKPSWDMSDIIAGVVSITDSSYSRYVFFLPNIAILQFLQKITSFAILFHNYAIFPFKNMNI